MDRLELYQALKTRLSEAELQEACFSLQVDYENLDGSVKNDKIRSLILYLERRERLGDLIRLLEPAFVSIKIDVTIITQSKTLIGRAEVEEAINLLLPALPKGTQWEQELLSLSSQYQHFNSDRLKGRLNSETEQVLFNQITDDLLRFVGQF